MRRILCLILLCLTCAGAEPLEYRYLFHPKKGLSVQPDSTGLPVREIYFKTEDGVRLNGWWLPAPRGGATVLYFHGNGGNLANTLATLEIFHKSGFGALAIDYRGYGLSEGTPSEEGLFRDARAAYAECLRRGVRAQDLYIHGQSLGGAVAVQLASERPAAGLIVESSFTSAPAIGRKLYGELARAMVTRLSSVTRISRVKCPVLVIHGTADSLIPVEMGRELFRAAPEPRWLWLVEGAEHNNVRRIAGERYGRRLQQFDRFCRPR